MDEIFISIKTLKAGKSAGPDSLSAEFFKSTCVEISPILKDIFNSILDSGICPKAFGESVLCPIHKSGPTNDPNNFRGIALVNTMYKIFSSILNKRLYAWVEETGKLDESQAGFRAGYSTIDNIFSLSAVVQKYLSKSGGRFYCLYVDFQKAFDKVEHEQLFKSLTKKGIHGKFLRAVKSMYSCLQATVRTVDGQTKPFPCNIGTRQGDISSPLLFALFINDLCTLLRENCPDGIFITADIPDLFCLMFADDIAHCAETRVRMQRQLDLIFNFCQLTNMTVNLNKTEIIVFRNGGPLRNYESWHFNGIPVRTTSQYKYLGLIFTPKLSWSKAKRKLAAQARKAIFCIKNYQRKFGYFLHADMFRLFDSMVKPILCYGSEVWGTEYSDVIESVHYTFCRYFMGVNQSVNNAVAIGECGRLPLCVFYFTNCIKYWCRLLHMQVNRYPKNCYKMLKSLDEAGRSNWASHVRNLLFMYGFSYVWLSQDIGDISMFIAQFKLRLIDCCSQKWHSDITGSTRCDTYKESKSLLNVEKYLCIDMPFYLRKAFARFRCSSLNLLLKLAGIET